MKRFEEDSKIKQQLKKMIILLHDRILCRNSKKIL